MSNKNIAHNEILTLRALSLLAEFKNPADVLMVIYDGSRDGNAKPKVLLRVDNNHDNIDIMEVRHDNTVANQNRTTLPFREMSHTDCDAAIREMMTGQFCKATWSIALVDMRRPGFFLESASVDYRIPKIIFGWQDEATYIDIERDPARQKSFPIVTMTDGLLRGGVSPETLSEGVPVVDNDSRPKLGDTWVTCDGKHHVKIILDNTLVVNDRDACMTGMVVWAEDGSNNQFYMRDDQYPMFSRDGTYFRRQSHHLDLFKRIDE